MNRPLTSRIPWTVVQVSAGLFLSVNLAARLAALHSFGLDIPLLTLGAALVFLASEIWPGLLPRLLPTFSFCFPLFCYQAYTGQSQLFEFLVTLLGILLWRRVRHRAGRPVDQVIAVLLACVTTLAVLSFVLLPVVSIFQLLSLWGPGDFSSAVLSAPPEQPLYSLAAMIRILLYVLVIFLLAWQDDAPDLYRRLLVGAAFGSVFASLIGLLNQGGIVSLEGLRPQFVDPAGVPRLHSVAGNPGWFAQYVLLTLPCIFLFSRIQTSRRVAYLAAGGAVMLSGLALLLTASRTSWLLFPLEFVLYGILLWFCRVRYGPAVRPLSGRSAGILLFVISVLLAGWLYLDRHVKPGEDASLAPAMSRAAYLRERLDNIFLPTERIKVWKESLTLGMEQPIFGLGYDGYKWHQQVMMTIPESRFHRNRQTSNNWDTPHNFFLHVFVSNGLGGVLLWLLLVGYTVLTLGCRLLRTGDAQALTVLISFGGGLGYGLTQSIQYIPVIWFVFLIVIGFGLVPVVPPEPGSIARKHPFVLSTCILLIVLGGGCYINNVQSRGLARTYGLHRYAVERGAVEYRGVYPGESWGEHETFHWSGRQAEIVFSSFGVAEFTIACNTPGLESSPVVVDVFANTVPLDRYTFWKNERVVRSYWLQEKQGEPQVILFKVHRTWNPKRAGQGEDTRNLGLAISGPRVVSEVPLGDLGMSEWQVQEDHQGIHRYRWTNRISILGVSTMAMDRWKVRLSAVQPYISERPQTVSFSQNGKTVATVQLTRNDWVDVDWMIPPMVAEPLVIHTEKVFNPLRQGYGGTPKDVGVALEIAAILPEIPEKH